MPRSPRYFLPGQPWHVVQRGNNRQRIFRSVTDYTVFLDMLAHGASRFRLRIHAYALMPNHFHLLATPGDGGCAPRVMQDVGRRYVRWYNARYSRTGTLWEGRYRTCLIDGEDYFLRCCRYIEFNPVRAGLCQSPGDYRWSSYAHNALGKANAILVEHDLYLRLAATPHARRSAYRALLSRPTAEDEVAAIRMATAQCRVLGGKRFQYLAEREFGGRALPTRRGRPSKSPESSPGNSSRPAAPHKAEGEGVEPSTAEFINRQRF